MPVDPIYLLLADDDQDDCLLFSEALQEVTNNTKLGMVHDGVELLRFLTTQNSANLPDFIFLDLNMPRKNGHECLTEIRKNKQYINIPIAIFSTSFDPATANTLRNEGADYYIRKPSDFSDLKNVLKEVITIIQSDKSGKANKDKFILLS